MDDKERKEYLAMLIAQKYELSYKLLMRRTIARIDNNKDQLSGNFENSDKEQLDKINTKLFLLGQ